MSERASLEPEFAQDEPGVRSSSVLSVVSAIAGWTALLLSVFTAAFGGRWTGIKVFLGATGFFGIAGIVFAALGMARDRSRTGGIIALFGCIGAAVLLIAAAVWGLDEFGR